MKNLTKLLLFAVLTFLPFSVLAFELNCDEGEFEFEDYFQCSITGNNTTNYDVLSGTITINDYVSCATYTSGSGLTLQPVDNNTNNKSFSFSGKPDTNFIVNYRCQVIKKTVENQKIQLFINNFKHHEAGSTSNVSEEILRSNYITVKKYEEKTTTQFTTTKPRDTSNSNSRLKALADDNLNLTFSGFITEYNVEVLYEVDKLDLKIIPFNNEANVKVDGNMSLNVGQNVIDIYVTSPDGKSTTCYTLNVTRLARGEEIYYPEKDASLKNLTITGHNIAFDPLVFDYSIHLDRETSNVEVKADPTVDGATVDISNTNNLVNGSIITITIRSKDLSSETKYKIKVTKDAPKKDYTKIILLSVLGLLFIVIIVIIIITNKKNKSDPLLRIKKEKRKINHGTKFNSKIVPEANQNINTDNQTVIKEENVNIVKPTEVKEKIADDNLNKISSNVNTLNLNNASLPSQVPNNSNIVKEETQDNKITTDSLNSDNSIIELDD